MIALALGMATEAVVRPAVAAKNATIIVHGTFLSSEWEVVCGPVVDGQATCTASGGGPIYGGISGTTAVTATGELQLTAPFPEQTGSGRLVCDPCRVAGHGGAIIFAIEWSGSNTGLSSGTMVVTGASGDLTGLTGSGTWRSTAMAMAEAYTVELTLP